jgi:hypothetical protein
MTGRTADSSTMDRELQRPVAGQPARGTAGELYQDVAVRLVADVVQVERIAYRPGGHRDRGGLDPRDLGGIPLAMPVRIFLRQSRGFATTLEFRTQSPVPRPHQRTRGLHLPVRFPRSQPFDQLAHNPSRTETLSKI